MKKKLYASDNEVEREGALESVGAFPLNPRDDRKNKKDLLEFLSDFIIDLINLN